MRTNNDRPAVRVSALRIHNVLGIVDAEIKPGAVTIVQGSNGRGKTSIIEAFKAVLKGGHDGTLLRNGEESGEIVMILSDGTEIEKRIRPADSKTKVTHPDFGQLSKPAQFLDGLRDIFAINPVEFLTAKPEKRVELLLSAIPLTVSPIDLAGIAELCSSKPDLSRHALQVLAGIAKDLFDQRTGINRSAKDKRASVEELRRALPEDPGPDGANVLAAVELEYSDFRENCEAAKAEVQTKANSLVNDLEDQKRTAVEALNRKRDEEIEEIRTAYARQVDAVRNGINQRVQLVSDAAGKELETIAQNRISKTQQFESALAKARSNAEAFIRSKSAREHIARMQAGAETLEADAQTLSAALSELDVVRGNLLEKLPIKGVTLADGDIFVDGVPFDRVNESRRIRLAIEIAMLRAGNLPFMAVDGAERLDSTSLQTLGDVAVEMGIQLVLSKVTDGPLEVSRIA